MSDAGVKQETGSVGLGWLALRAGRGELVVAEAIGGEVEGEVGDVNLEKMRAVHRALAFVVAVAQGQAWEGEDPAGDRQLASGDLAKVRAEARGIRERSAFRTTAG